jgi:hypothetical protein
MLALAAPAAAETETFSYTGAAQTWTVPARVTEASFDLYGAQGAGLPNSEFSPGLGGRASATIAVDPGAPIQINVGGQGSEGGFNGGGLATTAAGGGGGASDIRIGGTALTNRRLVAGGGGGAGGGTCPGISVAGGSGGGESGQPGGAGCGAGVSGGGGTQFAGGTSGGDGTPGVLGFGGSGLEFAGGGGGGYYGGGSGAGDGAVGGGGGGGSGFGPEGTVFESGIRSGNGLITVTYTVDPPPPDPPTPDPPPVITSLQVVPESFAASGSATPLVRAKGAQIELTLSEDAKVRFRIRQNPERRNGGPAPRNPRSFTRNLNEGANSVPFTGRLGKAAFKPRRYKLIARARDSAGQRSARVDAAFRITP